MLEKENEDMLDLLKNARLSKQAQFTNVIFHVGKLTQDISGIKVFDLKLYFLNNRGFFFYVCKEVFSVYSQWGLLTLSRHEVCVQAWNYFYAKERVNLSSKCKKSKSGTEGILRKSTFKIWRNSGFNPNTDTWKFNMIAHDYFLTNIYKYNPYYFSSFWECHKTRYFI